MLVPVLVLALVLAPALEIVVVLVLVRVLFDYRVDLLRWHQSSKIQIARVFYLLSRSGQGGEVVRLG